MMPTRETVPTATNWSVPCRCVARAEDGVGGTRPTWRRRAAVATAVVAIGAWGWTQVHHTSAHPTTANQSAAVPTGGATPALLPATGAPAVDVLASLTVKGRAPKTGYSRSLFGGGWSIEGAPSCTTRESILRRDLHPSTVAGGCVVISG